MFDVVCGFLYDLAVMETMIDVDKKTTDDVVAVKASIIDDFDVGFHVFGKATIEEGGLEVEAHLDRRTLVHGRSGGGPCDDEGAV